MFTKTSRRDQASLCLSGNRPSYRAEHCRAIRRQSAGFILLEVLLASVIMALALTAAIGAATTGAGSIATLRERTLAQIVASNKLTEMQLTREWPKKNRSQEKTTMAKLDWLITVETEPTAAEIFEDIIVQAQISVALADRPNSRLRTITGFLVRDVSPPTAEPTGAPR